MSTSFAGCTFLLLSAGFSYIFSIKDHLTRLTVYRTEANIYFKETEELTYNFFFFCRDGSVVRSMTALAEGSDSIPTPTRWLTTVSSVPEDSTPSPGLTGHQAHTWSTHITGRQNTLTHQSFKVVYQTSIFPPSNPRYQLLANLAFCRTPTKD